MVTGVMKMEAAVMEIVVMETMVTEVMVTAMVMRRTEPSASARFFGRSDSTAAFWSSKRPPASGVSPSRCSPMRGTCSPTSRPSPSH